MNGKLKRKARFFYPLCSLLVFVAGANSCRTIDDLIIVLSIWSSIYIFCMAIVCFPSKFSLTEVNEKD
jgi:hypothetical protein